MGRSRLSGKVGAALDPCGAIQLPFELAAGPRARVDLSVGNGKRRRRCPSARPALSRSGGKPNGAGNGVAALDAYPGGGACGDSRSVPQCACQWLAAVSNARLPSLGAKRILSVGRRLWVPRSVAGRDGAGPCQAATRCGNKFCCAQAVSSRRETCNIGGILPPAGASARAVPMIFSGFPLPRAAMS